MDKGQIRVVEAQPITMGLPGPGDNASPGSYANQLLIRGILRRWYLVLISTVLISGVATPLIWRLVQPSYRATAAIRVAPIIPAILFQDQESQGTLPMYGNFVNTQAQLMTSEVVLQRVADDLSDRDLALFRPHNPAVTAAQRLNIPLRFLQKMGLPTDPPQRDPVDILRQAVAAGLITAEAGSGTELITVTVESEDPEDARILADAIVRAYMVSEGSRSSLTDDNQLTILEQERRTLAERIQRQHENIRTLAEQYGTTALGGRREMMLERVADLQKEKTRVEARRIALEARLQLLESTQDDAGVPQQIAERQQQYINNDATIQALTLRLAELEQELIVAQQTLTVKNPRLQQIQTLINAFRARLDERRGQLAQEFNEAVNQEQTRGVSDNLALTRAELEQTKAHEAILNRELSTENEATIDLGRKQLAIDDQQKQLALNEELYDTISQRIRELQVEQKRPGRISVAFNASTQPLPSKRVKMIVAAFFGSVCFGLGLAFLQTKRDQRIRSPEEIMRRIGVPVLGTTITAREAAKKGAPHLLADDYHAIRSNLGLRSEGKIPHTLAIVSAGIGEGKTTLAINLASSLAATGRRILLIDGDFSKADAAALLGVSTNGRGAADVLLGRKAFSQTVQSTCQQGLDLLPGNCRDIGQATEALNCKQSREILAQISQQYDHVIIDTPPILVGPMALLWAKLADGVVLSTMAGRTQYPELRETVERLANLNVPVIGNVLSNVSQRHSYHRYDYYYNTPHGSNQQNTKADKGRHDHLLIPPPKTDSQAEPTS